MSNPPEPRFENDLFHYTIGTERLKFLCDLITTAREDLRPTNFAERHLVDDLAISKWRISRVAIMEKAVFERQRATFERLDLKDDEGQLIMPHEDIYHLTLAYGKDPDFADLHAVILAALSRLDARYARQFCTSLRLLIALRRGTPPPVPNARPAKASKQSTKANLTKANLTNGKDKPTCEPSQTTPPVM